MAAGPGTGRGHRNPVRGCLFTCTPAESAAASRSASPRPSSTARRTTIVPGGPDDAEATVRAAFRPAGEADAVAPGVPGRGSYLRPARSRIRRAAVRCRLRRPARRREPAAGATVSAGIRPASPTSPRPATGRCRRGPRLRLLQLRSGLCQLHHRDGSRAWASTPVAPGLRLRPHRRRMPARCPAAWRCRPGLCHTHYGDADVARAGESSAAARADPACGSSGSTCAAFPGALEIRYVLQCRGMSGSRGCAPLRCHILRDLAATTPSLLERTRAAGHQRPRGGRQFTWMPGPGSEHSAAAGKWNSPPGAWRLRDLGVGSPGEGSRRHRLRAIGAPRSLRPPWPSAGAGGGCGPELSAGEPRKASGCSGDSPPFLAAHAAPGIHRPHAAGTLPGRPVRHLSPGSCQGHVSALSRNLLRDKPPAAGRRLPARHCGLLSRDYPSSASGRSPPM